MIRAIRTLRSDLLLLVVTKDPPQFQEIARPLGRSVLPQLFPKPVFGWTILDAIRLHAVPGGACVTATRSAPRGGLCSSSPSRRW